MANVKKLNVNNINYDIKDANAVYSAYIEPGTPNLVLVNGDGEDIDTIGLPGGGANRYQATWSGLNSSNIYSSFTVTNPPSSYSVGDIIEIAPGAADTIAVASQMSDTYDFYGTTMNYVMYVDATRKTILQIGPQNFKLNLTPYVRKPLSFITDTSDLFALIRAITISVGQIAYISDHAFGPSNVFTLFDSNNNPITPSDGCTIYGVDGYIYDIQVFSSPVTYASIEPRAQYPFSLMSMASQQASSSGYLLASPVYWDAASSRYKPQVTPAATSAFIGVGLNYNV